MNSHYAPSWVNRFSDYIDRIPLPYWLVYTLIVLFVFGSAAIPLTLANPNALRDWAPINYVVLFQIPYFLSVIHYLDRKATETFSKVEPALRPDAPAASALQRQLATMPARPVLLVTVAFAFAPVMLDWLAFTTGSIESLAEFSMSPLGYYQWFAQTLLWIVNGLVLYHTVHQLRVVNHIYTNFMEIHPFHQRQLFTFSGLSARTGIAITLVTVPWVLIEPTPDTLSISFVFALVGILAFISPLLGAHRLLEEAKDQLLDENGRHLEDAVTSLNRAFQEDRPAEVKDSSSIIQSLSEARAQIDTIRTWPWKGETLRQVVFAVFIPILVWLIQYFLSSLVSK